MPIHRQAEVQRQVAEMLDAGVVEPSQSPWAAPVVLVRKKNGTHRFCVDYRKLNHATVKDAHPLPRTDDTIDALSGSAYFTTLDMTAGYWQVPVHPDDREKTAFTTGRGLYQFTVMAFGLTNAPSTFQRLMELLLAGLDWRSCLAYLDDIILFSRTFEDHLTVLEEVLSRFRSANLKLNAEKCKFAQPKVHFLGHVVSRHGVQPDPTNTDKVRNWPTPTSIAHVRSFLGLASYYRKFVRHFAKIAEPLHVLTRKGSSFSWSSDCQAAFETLREALTSPPILAYPDFSRPFTLHTDASDSAVGAVLSQTTDRGEQVVAYASCTLTAQGRRWATFDREMWAVVWSIRHFRTYLAGRRFTVMTDHKPLLGWSNKLTTHDPTGRRSRWAVELSTYEFDLTYRAGKANSNADALSRLPAPVATVDQPPTLPQDPLAEQPTAPLDNPPDGQLPPPPTDPPDEHLLPRADALSRLPASVAAVDQPPTLPHDPSANQPTVPLDDPPDGQLPPPPTDPPDGHSLPHKVQQAQEADQDISEIIQWKRQRQGRPPWHTISRRGRSLKALWDQYHSLVVKRGVLYRRWKPNANCHVIYQRVAPTSLRPAILQELHNGSCSGHLGITKTLRRVYIRFYWPGMNQDVKRWCRACQHCATRTAPTPSARAPLKPIRADGPFKKVAMDLTELPKSKKRNRYCLVLQDFFTKYANAYAIPRQDAPTVAQVLFTHYIREHGVPSSLHSDQGRQFEADLMKELYAALGIAKSRTTPYHPQGDGLVERFNRTLKAMLSKYVSPMGDDWDDHLSHVLLAYNTSVHASTGYTPFLLAHGREANLPADMIFGTTPPGAPPTTTARSYVKTLTSSLRTAFAHARQNMQRASSRQKAAYDSTTSHRPYKTGDKVWVNDPTALRRKLKPRWKGPFVVMERLHSDGEPGVTYRIKDARSNRRKIVHYNRLKPCYTLPTVAQHRDRQPVPTGDAPTSQLACDSFEDQAPQQATSVGDTNQHTTRHGRRVTRPSRFADCVMD
ncbi:RTL1 [Branchiostoma lanceolatum]|uniref:Gypsy retrotransposon integrase-like protein 1 n=1 Tax=Branchiostoma lanceolatum TaxID=7740 RepID=A0A8K0ADJ2_BRALA|nr:RTL1 [Branchiostoma lanceolatum]